MREGIGFPMSEWGRRSGSLVRQKRRLVFPGRGGCLGSPGQNEEYLGPHVRLKEEIERGVPLMSPGQAECEEGDPKSREEIGVP